MTKQSLAAEPAARAMGVIVGRQPKMVQITPSKPNPWYGGIIGGTATAVAIVGGQSFTAQQLHALKAKAIDPEAVERITVRRNATHDEMYWATGDYPPVFEFECPVLDRRVDGRIRVIAPSGVGKLVFDHGWITDKPARKKSAYGW